MAKSIINCYEGDLGQILKFSVNNFSSMAILVGFLHKDIKRLQKTLNSSQLMYFVILKLDSPIIPTFVFHRSKQVIHEGE